MQRQHLVPQREGNIDAALTSFEPLPNAGPEAPVGHDDYVVFSSSRV
jgi:hypothetical protein